MVIRSENSLSPLTPNEKRVAEARRESYGLYAVTHCDTEPPFQAIRDPAALPWHEVKKVDHYWLSVDAMKPPVRVREELLRDGEGGNQP